MKKTTKKITLAQQAAARAATLASAAPSVAGYLAGINPVNDVTVKDVKEVMSLLAPADSAAFDAMATAQRLHGGALALGIVAILVAGQCADVGKGKTLKGAADYVQETAKVFQGKVGTVQKSVAKLLAESLHFTASNTSDVNTVWQEACAAVRAAMTKHNSLKAWEKAVRGETGANKEKPVKRQARAECNAIEPDTDETNSEAPAKKAGRNPKEKPVTVNDLKTGNTLDLIGGAETLFAEIAKRAIENTDETAGDYLSKIAAYALEAFEAAERARERATQNAKRYRKPAAKAA